MKKINILGISAFFHDSAVTLLQDGKIKYASQEERFSRIKHDSNFPLNALADLLKFNNLDYAPFFKTPKIFLEESIDMKKWNKVKLSDEFPKEYRWPEEIKIDLHISGVKHKFLRVKIQER